MPNIAPTPIRLKDPSGYTSYSCDNSEGFFFLYLPRGDGVQNAFHCREELAVDWDEDAPRCRWLGFMWNSQIMVRRIERLWTDLETKMGVTEHTVFHRVTDGESEGGAPSIEKTQVLLHLSPFWTKTQTHRSVCSLLLRLLIVYYTGSWNAAINAYELAKECREALEWFLAGNTRPSYRHWGDAYEKDMAAYDKAFAKWEKACAKLDESDNEEHYPDEPEEPRDRESDFGVGFNAMFTERSTDEIRRLLVKP